MKISTAAAGFLTAIPKSPRNYFWNRYRNMYKFELMVIRPANVYGLGHFWSGSGGGEKIQALLVSGLKGEVAKIPQEQTMAFEYVYCKDIGRAMDLAATVPMAEQNVFNIAEGKVTQFQEIVDMIKKLLPKCSVEIVPGTAPVSRTQHLDISRAKRSGMGAAVFHGASLWRLHRRPQTDDVTFSLHYSLAK